MPFVSTQRQFKKLDFTVYKVLHFIVQFTGTKINGTHAEYVRVPYGENSVIKIPKTMNLTDALLLSDVLPTGYENVIKRFKTN